MNKNEKNFGAFLRQIRLTEVGENVKTSLRKLAEEAEIDPAYLSRIERGEIQRPGRETIEKIAAALCRMKEFQEADCEELNRKLLLKAKYKLSIDELGLKPHQSIEELFAQRLRDLDVPETFILDLKEDISVHQMSKVLSGEEPLPLSIKNIDNASYEEKFSHNAIKRTQRDGTKEYTKIIEKFFKEAKEDDIQLHISPDDSSMPFEDSDSDYIKKISNFIIRDVPQRSQRVEDRKFRAGARAFIQVDGELTTSQEEQIRALTTVLRSILKVNK